MTPNRDLAHQDAANSVSTPKRALKVRRRRGDVPLRDPTVTPALPEGPGAAANPEAEAVPASGYPASSEPPAWLKAQQRATLLRAITLYWDNTLVRA